MEDLHATVRLRPTRVGFLVHPTRLRELKNVMSAAACLWGGIFNPIIPICRSTPREWKEPSGRLNSGQRIARGYIRFFEPDVYVEAEEGLLEKVGLGAIRGKQLGFADTVLTLEQFLAGDDERRPGPRFGIDMVDVLRHRYLTEQRFQLKHPVGAVQAKPVPKHGIAEAIFGTYPRDEALGYFERGYTEVFGEQAKEPSPAMWLEVFKNGAMTPLRLTRQDIDVRRYWHHDPIVFVFDPHRPTDLIDLWNIRIEPNPVVPLPVDWIDDLKGFIRDFIRRQHRPIRGNPQGLMHNVTVEFSRSLGEEKSQELADTFLKGLKGESSSRKFWRNPIWQPNLSRYGLRYERGFVSAGEKNTRLRLGTNDSLRTEFDSISPTFAEKYGGHNARWANVLSPSGYGHYNIATSLPFNTFNPEWPRLGLGGEQVGVTSEGWIYLQRFHDHTESVSLLSAEDAITQWFANRHIKASLSEPGRIARDMLNRLEGPWGINLLADADTLELLNSMAARRRTRSNDENVVEEEFESRAVDVKRWNAILRARKKRRLMPPIEIDLFIERNVLRLGLESLCPHCMASNWRGMDEVDYTVRCDRCLKEYPFPKNPMGKSAPLWKFRVIGPFAVPDYGRGAYPSLLALRTLTSLNFSRENNTFSTALELDLGDAKVEVDFILWSQEGRLSDRLKDIEVVIGETKSFGAEAIKKKDLDQLR